MSNLTRISITVEEDTLRKFDEYTSGRGFPTRSEAVKSLMRQAVVEDEWMQNDFVAGTVTLVYDHHKPGIVDRLLDAQHDFYREIQCSQHVHLDHDNCMEIIIVKGKSEQIQALLVRIRQIKGLKHIVLTMSTVGE